MTRGMQWIIRFYTTVLVLVLITAPTVSSPTVPASFSASLQSVQPDQISFFGMNTYITGLERINNDGDDGIATLIALGRAAGVEWAREELSWGNLERRGKNRWDWRYFDRRLRQLAEAGYGIIGMLLTTPAWARVADCEERTQRYAAAGVYAEDYWCPPANVQDFADYVYAMVERYNGDGYRDAPGSPRVAVWQIWNEPNAWETWPGTPAEYGALLQAGYAAVKAADPTAIVLTGGLYVLDGHWADTIGHSDGLRFLDAALAAVPEAWYAFDALAIHPYLPDVAPDQPGILSQVTLWGRIATSRDWLASRTRFYGGRLRPIWISEVGWSTCNPAESFCSPYPGGVAQGPQSDTPRVVPDYRLVTPAYPHLAATTIGKTETEQANYLVRAHVIALAAGVQHVSYFQLADKFVDTRRDFWQAASIVYPKRENYRPKQAYYAYANLTRQLAGAAYVGPGILHTFAYDAQQHHHPVDRYHFRFQRPDRVLVDVLWRNGGTEVISLPLEAGHNSTLVTLGGQHLAFTAESGIARFTVSEEPVYLRQGIPPVLEVQPQVLTLLAAADDASRISTLVIRNLGAGEISWSASSNVTWLQPVSAVGRGWQSGLTLQANPTGLATGVHEGILHINSNGGTQNVTVRLIVLPEVWRLYIPIVAR